MPAASGRHKALSLPPGFTARPDAAPWDTALAAAGTLSPGTLLHAPLDRLVDAALILAPDRPIGEETALRLGSLAVHDALAAIIPPEMPLTLFPPGRFTVNRGEVASLSVAHGPPLPDGTPDWLVLGFTVRVAMAMPSPGSTPWLTDLAEEGAGIAAATLLGSICRHLLAVIDLWQTEGAPGIDRAWHQARHHVAADA